jgi:uncharacterized protein (DUF952 family)
MKNNSFEEQFLYHISSQEDLTAARTQGSYQADSLHTEGFIHCSFQRQILKTANRFYRNMSGLVMLKIDKKKLQSEIRIEAAPDGELFPHIYGKINLESIIDTLELEPDPDGEFKKLPKGCV